MSEVIVGLASLNARLSAISGPAANRALMERVQLRTLETMKRRIPRRTSFTSRTLHPGPASAAGATILGSRNALWLDQGTKPHLIRAKNAKALRWAASPAGRRLSGRPTVAAQRGKNGGLAFATYVHHPGTRAQPFIADAVQEAFTRSGLTDGIVERWDSAA